MSLYVSKRSTYTRVIDRSISKSPKAKSKPNLLELRMSLQKVFYPLPFFNGNITNGCVRQTALTDLEWHTLPTIDVEKRLTTSITDGLSADQAKRRQAEYGRNAPSPAKTHWFRTIFLYFFGGFGSILLIGCILVFISWKPLGDPPAVANLVCATTEHALLKSSY